MQIYVSWPLSRLLLKPGPRPKSQHKYPSRHFLFSKTSSRRLQRNTFRLPRRLQDVFKTYLQYVFLKRLQDVFKTFSRRLQDVFQDVFKTFSRRLQDVFQDVFKTASRRLAIMSSRPFQYVFKTPSVRLHQDECLLGQNALSNTICIDCNLNCLI